MEKKKAYIAIDLKSFYASVECVYRKLDPLTVNLVVADESRTEKTICLAVSPSLKAYGIPGRARLFEVIQKVQQINADRLRRAPGHKFTGSSYFADELNRDPSLKLDFVIAMPRMAEYMKISTGIFKIYMKYISPEDIHVYSIDEVFIDATDYLETYKMTPRELAMKMILEVLDTTGITATAGIGTNLYLCKIAMDVEAKHIAPDKNGVRIAELDEQSFRVKMWDHRPLTDFWRIGAGYDRRLKSLGLETMGDIARYSLNNEDKLYKMFGINAELLIDHAWGIEPTEMKHIKSYTPENNSLSTGQVLSEPYSFEKARLVVREMADMLSLDLVEKRVVTDQMVLTICYDNSNAISSGTESDYDRYGRIVPKNAHGSINLGMFTSSSKKIIEAVTELYDKIVERSFTVRRIYVVANHVIYEKNIPSGPDFEQLDFFTDYEEIDRQREKEKAELVRERKKQEAILTIKKKYGKNSILKGMNYEQGATAKQRNEQVGGHKA